jgi:hypothetical protein
VEVQEVILSKMLRGLAIAIAVVLLCITAAGCGGAGSEQPLQPSEKPQGPPVLQSIAAYPSSLNNVDNRAVQQLTITATYSDGKTEEVTDQCTYETTDRKVATVDKDGFLMALTPGDATVTVIFTEGGVTKTTTIPVSVVFMMP